MIDSMTTTYRYRGTTDDLTTCEECGREELHSTVVLAVEVDGEDAGVIHVGSTCAARFLSRRTGRTVTTADVRKGLREAERVRLEEEQERRDAEDREFIARRDAILRSWGIDPRTARPTDCLRACKEVQRGE